MSEFNTAFLQHESPPTLLPQRRLLLVTLELPFIENRLVCTKQFNS